jgi:hypothetical protein
MASVPAAICRPSPTTKYEALIFTKRAVVVVSSNDGADPAFFEDVILNTKMNSTSPLPVAYASGRGDRLIGWKAIGRYLGCTARTARRWEIARGLPVHRINGSRRGSVWGAPEELQRWLHSMPTVAQPVAPVESAGEPKSEPPPSNAIPIDTRAPWLLVAIALVLVVLSAVGLQWNQ